MNHCTIFDNESRCTGNDPGCEFHSPDNGGGCRFYIKGRCCHAGAVLEAVEEGGKGDE